MYRRVVLGAIPDPLVLPDGSRVRTAAQWEAQRERLLGPWIDLVYGGMPPAPDSVELEPRHTPGPGRKNSYRVTCRRGEESLSFTVTLTRPREEGPRPVVLTGDGCYDNMNGEVVEEINRRGMIAANFNRTDLAADIKGMPRDHGLYRLYPEGVFGALSAWAWGYSRCMDVLQTLDFVDAKAVAITGHSRGGKTTLLAGATDPRFALVHANNSGAGGTGCWRYQMRRDNAENPYDRSEVLGDLIRHIPYWFGPKLPDYVGHEERLPQDQFLLLAAVAPGKLLDTQGLADIWANPEGTMQTHFAAREIYKLYGREDRIRLQYREGGHDHGIVEYKTLMDFLQDQPCDPSVWSSPYEGEQPIFDWRAT